MVGGVSGLEAKADQIQRDRRGEFEAVIFPDPIGKLLGQSDVLPDVMLQAFDSVMAENKPQFQGAEATAERDVLVAVVDDGAGFGGLVAEVFRQHAESLDQGFAVGDVEDVAVEVGEHPLVRVEAVAVGVLDPGVDVAELGTECGGA